jgi:hypothetical protein
MDLTDYDSIIKSLATIAVHQDTINRRLEETQHDIHALLQQQSAITAQQAVVNAQNTTLIMRIVRTLDRIDEKLDRIFPERS